MSEPVESIRLDKWLWTVRIYKTRTDATEACRSSAVRINGEIAKPSAKLRRGDRVIARTKALTRTVEVIDLSEKRIGAPRVYKFLNDQTSESEYEAAQEKRKNARLFGQKGSGRPTKKDRRDIERLIGPEDGY